MSFKVQQSVCSDCVTYVKSRIKFNKFNTFNNVDRIDDFDANRKRNYPQVGEPTLREGCEDTTERKGNGVGVKTVLAGVLAVLMTVTTGVVMLALAGAAVLFMPMLGGLAKE